MKTAAVIAEYNPFHLGHFYQLQTLREETQADFLLIVMSGDFVQRGEPAVFDKYTRTRMALSCGGDLVVELPVSFATGSAERFAFGAVSLLEQLNTVDILCFGSESGNLAELSQAARLLWAEPPEFSAALKEGLKEGLSFPAARSRALQALAGCLPSPGSSLLSSPNNILAVEYLKALIRLNSPIAPLTIQRKGQGYHDCSAPGPAEFASASSLRAQIQAAAGSGFNPGSPVLQCLDGCLPSPAWEALCAEGAAIAPIFPNDLSLLLNSRILTLLQENVPLSRFADLSPELEARLKAASLDFSSFSGRIAQLKTRQYTYTRVSRALLHLLLGIEDPLPGSVPYARILGFRRRAAPLLSALKSRSQIPLVTKIAAAPKRLDPSAQAVLNQELSASHLYQALAYQKGRRMRNEYNRPLLILP